MKADEIVLSRVVIPEYVVVHDGPPSDSAAENYYVGYKDYIKMLRAVRYMLHGRAKQLLLIYWQYSHLR